MMKTIFKILLIFVCILFTSVSLMANDFWIKKNFPDSVYITQVRIDQNDILFASGIFFDSIGGLPHGRIYRSVDFAQTWQNISPHNYFHEIFDILIGENGTIFLGTWYGGVYRSYDNGENFEQVSSGLSNSVPTYLAQQSDGTIYAGQFWGGGVDYSENEGDQWYSTSFPLGGINGLGVDNYNGVYASAGGLFYSDDDGLTWSERNNGFSGNAMSGYKCFAFTESTKVFTGTINGIYFSENNGEEWIKCLNSGRIYSIQIFNDKIFASTYDEGVYFSDDDANSWSQKNDGLESFTVKSFAVDSDNHLWCNTAEGIYRSSEDLVSIDPISNNHKDIYIFPNPCGSNLNLCLPDKNFQNVNLTFLDVSGKLVLQINKKMTEFVLGNNSLAVDNLKSGIYLLSITVDGQIKQTEKLVIL